MTISREIKRQQRKWAGSRNLAIDQNGYCDDPGHNLFRPLCTKFEQALKNAGGGELEPQRARRPKISALHSSAVLAINVFQYWDGRTGPELPRALAIDGILEDVEIERPFASGLRGTPPTLDVVLSLSSERLVAIESKFTEWMPKKRPKLEHFNEKYLKGGPLWLDAGLPECQRLAADIAEGKEAFRHLDARQLLKHALGLSKSAPGAFTLLYLYYDYERPSPAAELHRAELARFAERADDRLGFRAMSYQGLFGGLAAQSGVDEEYLEYLRGRYSCFSPVG